MEKDLTLELALLVEQALEKDIASDGNARVRAILTRRNDTNLDFAERAEVAASLRPAPVAVISLHFNALNGREKGTVAMVGARPANANYARDAAFARELTEEVSNVVRNYVPGSEARPTIDDGHLHGGKGSNFRQGRCCRAPYSISGRWLADAALWPLQLAHPALSGL